MTEDPTDLSQLPRIEYPVGNAPELEEVRMKVKKAQSRQFVKRLGFVVLGLIGVGFVIGLAVGIAGTRAYLGV